MRIVNLVRDAAPKRLGIIKSITDTAPALSEKGAQTELWHGGAPLAEPLPCTRDVVLPRPFSGSFKRIALKQGLDPTDTVVVTHGPWGFQTLWGERLRRLGFVWVYTPHGALEPWSMGQKRLKKSLYFRFLEGPLARRAAAMRALSPAEDETLRRRFPRQRVERIPNGIEIPDAVSRDAGAQAGAPLRFLFLARIHHKKGAARLVEAWHASSLRDDPEVELILAGPDEGEHALFAHRLVPDGNVSYVGPAFGPEKEALLRTSTFYVLPSLSEGLPVSVLEAIAAGLIPLITDECNVPEFFVDEGAVRITSDVDGIISGLEEVRAWSQERMASHRVGLRALLVRHYDIRGVAEELFAFYSGLLRHRNGS